MYMIAKTRWGNQRRKPDRDQPPASDLDPIWRTRGSRKSPGKLCGRITPLNGDEI